MKRNWLRTIIGGLSFGTMLFVFEACYGTPQDNAGFDVLVQGKVKSKATGQAIKGIKVSAVYSPQFQYTDDQGKFSFYVFTGGTFALKFQDTDSIQNETYQSKDTTLYNARDTVFVDVALENK
jgi:hypothetical protein